LPPDSAYGSDAMEFRILGSLEVSAGDGAIKLGGPKQRAVLAHLIQMVAERRAACVGDGPPDAETHFRPADR